MLIQHTSFQFYLLPGPPKKHQDIKRGFSLWHGSMPVPVPEPNFEPACELRPEKSWFGNWKMVNVCNRKKLVTVWEPWHHQWVCQNSVLINEQVVEKVKENGEEEWGDKVFDNWFRESDFLQSFFFFFYWWCLCLHFIPRKTWKFLVVEQTFVDCFYFPLCNKKRHNTKAHFVNKTLL